MSQLLAFRQEQRSRRRKVMVAAAAASCAIVVIAVLAGKYAIQRTPTTELHPLLGNLVTTGVSTSINASKLFVSQRLFRLYASKIAGHRVLGLSTCFHDHPSNRFDGPLFVAANILYDPTPPNREEELQRSWDPWFAFLTGMKIGATGRL